MSAFKPSLQDAATPAVTRALSYSANAEGRLEDSRHLKPHALPSAARWRPANLALGLQLLALLCTSFCAWLSIKMLGSADMLALIMMQSAFAAGFATLWRMATWWRLIQFVFPLALFFTLMLEIPSWVYLTGFLLTLSLFWTTFRTQVPFYPSRPEVWQRIKRALPDNRAVHLIDIGSGLGDCIMFLAQARPESRFVGIEIAPLPYLLSCMRSGFRRLKNARFKLGDYERLNFADFDVVFAYLSPAAMSALWLKASQEMRSGTMLMSYEFNIPNATPDEIIESAGHPPLYVWRF